MKNVLDDFLGATREAGQTGMLIDVGEKVLLAPDQVGLECDVRGDHGHGVRATHERARPGVGKVDQRGGSFGGGHSGGEPVDVAQGCGIGAEVGEGGGYDETQVEWPARILF